MSIFTPLIVNLFHDVALAIKAVVVFSIVKLLSKIKDDAPLMPNDRSNIFGLSPLYASIFSSLCLAVIFISYSLIAPKPVSNSNLEYSLVPIDKSQKVAVTFHRDKLGRVVCAGSSVNPFKRFLDPLNTPSHKTSGNHFRSYNNSQNMSVQEMGYYENQTPV